MSKIHPSGEARSVAASWRTNRCPVISRNRLFWHIDRFETGEHARAAVVPASVAFEAHGAWWLMSVESQTESHHGGQHVTEVKLLPLPEAHKYSMVVISAYIPSGWTSRVHLHSGVEAFYVVDGEQCLETADRAFKMQKARRWLFRPASRCVS